MPVDQVWSLIEPVERLPEWFTASESAELLGGQELGRRQRLSGRWRRRSFQIDQTVIAYELQRLLAWQHDSERLDGKAAQQISRHTEFRIELQPEGRSTRVRLVSRQIPGNVFKAILVRLVRSRNCPKFWPVREQSKIADGNVR